jgi:hypothetical protein
MLLKIGRGLQSKTFRSSQAKLIELIGKAWLDEICWAYNNKPYEEGLTGRECLLLQEIEELLKASEHK